MVSAPTRSPRQSTSNYCQLRCSSMDGNFPTFAAHLATAVHVGSPSSRTTSGRLPSPATLCRAVAEATPPLSCSSPHLSWAAGMKIPRIRIPGVSTDLLKIQRHTGACTINRPCAQQYVGKSQSCMVISGRLIVHAPGQARVRVGLLRSLAAEILEALTSNNFGGMPPYAFYR